MRRTDPIQNSNNRSYPRWLPKGARNYLDHVEGGQSIRALAREQGCHASTILRQVRKFEKRRDEFLIDEALQCLEAAARKMPARPPVNGSQMTSSSNSSQLPADDTTVEQEGRRILRRLSETGAVLAVSRDMEKAVVVRELADGRTLRTGVVDRSVAQAMAMNCLLYTSDAADD